MDFSLEIDNISYREQIQELQYEVASLKQWKDRAIEHMLASAPKRNKIQQEYTTMVSLQHKLSNVLKDIGSRSGIENQLGALKDENATLKSKLQTLNSSISSSNDKLEKEQNQAKALGKKNKRFAEALKNLYSSVSNEEYDGNDLLLKVQEYLENPPISQSNTEELTSLEQENSQLQLQLSTIKESLSVETGVSSALETQLSASNAEIRNLKNLLTLETRENDVNSRALAELAKDAKKYIGLLKKKSSDELKKNPSAVSIAKRLGVAFTNLPKYKQKF